MFFGVRSVFSDLLVFRSKFCPALLLFWSFWVQVRHLFFKWFAFGLVLVGWFDVDFFFRFSCVSLILVGHAGVRLQWFRSVSFLFVLGGVVCSFV